MTKNKKVLTVILVFLLVLSAMFQTEKLTVLALEENTYETEEKEMTQAENLNFRGYDVVYVIDNSRSVWSQQEIRNQAFRNITNLAVGADIRVGVVYFADHIYETLSLTSMESHEGSEKVLNFLNMTKKDENNIDTNIGNALEAAVQLFEGQDSSREQIIILFSDGINENLTQDASYRSAANAKTEEQAVRLKEMGIPIYCVYLQKSRNDEAYLQDLVQYFSEDEDPSYVGVHFSKVTENEIWSLSDKFSEVFYAMQNNMKYRKLVLDSSGSANFYVPSLGIRKLQVYMDGNIQEGSLNPPAVSEYTKWQEGNATFINYDNPPVGEWSIQAAASEPGSVYGTIAYYTYLQASAELVKTDSAKEYELIVHFYDEYGKNVQIDQMSKVEGCVVMCGEDGTEIPLELNMSVSEGAAKSRPFEMDFYGQYHFEINLSYEDFVHLNYRIQGGVMEKNAPVTKDMEGAAFVGQTFEEGIRFSIKEESLYTDLEGDFVTVENIVQLNPSNPVTVEQSDGYMHVTALKDGPVNFELGLVDESGMTSKVMVSGNIIDESTVRIAQGIILVIVLIGILLCLRLIYNRNKQKSSMAKHFEEFEGLMNEYREVQADCQMEMTKLEDLEEDMECALFGDGDMKGIIDLSEALTEEQKSCFHIDKYFDEQFKDKIFGKVWQEKASLDAVERKMDNCLEKVDSMKTDNKNTGSAIQAMADCCRLAAQNVEKIREIHKILRIRNEMLDKEIGEIGTVAGRMIEMLDTQIKCDLCLRNITGMDDSEGRKSCRDNSGRFLKGFYKLDDVTILGHGKLVKNIGESGIYVYGFEGVDGETGLELRSNREFWCSRKEDSSNIVPVTRMVLLKGQEYELEFRNIRMSVSVK